MHFADKNQVKLSFAPVCRARRSTWLRYFATAVCMGAAQGQDQVLLDYWWVPGQKPTPEARVIRVIGAKGERYEEISNWGVSGETKERRLLRELLLRQEAMKLAREYEKENGTCLVTAYEKAWTEVLRRYGYNKDVSVEDKELKELITRVNKEDGTLNWRPGFDTSAADLSPPFL